MRRLVAALMVIGLLGPAFPARASSSVQIEDFRFSPRNELLLLGSQLNWYNAGTVSHTSTQDRPLRFWHVGQVAPSTFSDSTTMWAAGRYPYHCKNHASMHGLIRIPVTASSPTIALGDPVTITMSSTIAFKGYAFDLQRRREDTRWVTIRTGLGSATATVTPKRAGEFAFRARVVELDGGASGWSPAATVMVTGPAPA